LRVRPCLPIHGRDQLIPGIRKKLEAGAVGEQAPGTLARCLVAGARHAINVDASQEIGRPRFKPTLENWALTRLSAQIPTYRRISTPIRYPTSAPKVVHTPHQKAKF